MNETLGTTGLILQRTVALGEGERGTMRIFPSPA